MSLILRTLGLCCVVAIVSCGKRDSSHRDSGSVLQSIPGFFDSTAHEFLAAAQLGDSTRMAALTVDRHPVLVAEALATDQPDLLRSAQSGMTAKAFSRGSDTVGIIYLVTTAQRAEELSFTFIRRGPEWRIYRFGLPRQM